MSSHSRTRDILTVLTHPATTAATLTAPPGGPYYGAPAHACQLVPAATLRRYLPGAVEDPIGTDTPVAGWSGCQWNGPSGSWYVMLNLDVYSLKSDTGMLGPQAGYEVAVQQADTSSDDSTVLGTQPVTGFGGHATAIDTTSPQTAASPGVTLVAWSGDAVIQVSYQALFSTQVPTRSTELRIVTGLVHAAFAALPSGATLTAGTHQSPCREPDPRHNGTKRARAHCPGPCRVVVTV